MLYWNFIILLIAWLLITNLDHYGLLVYCGGGQLTNINFNFCLEWGEYSGYFFLMLLTCSNISFLYNFHYFGGYNCNSIALYKLLVIFVLVMFLLLGSYNLISSLILWEYLGFVSFLLVAYYDSSCSLRGSIITLVSSRFGDVAFFLLLSILYCGGGASDWLIGLLFLVIVGSKSAFFPFGSWLLEAMRAPTPVSSLVHSSTLVAAGVWFMVCYYNELGVVNNSVFHFVICVCCLLTIIYSGLGSLFNCDIKQIVALSTCNNISWVILISLTGDLLTGVLQLLVHAVSKCVLFTYVGDYIVSCGGGQSIHQLSIGYRGHNFNLVYMFIILVGLSGLPFVGLYFVKHSFMSTLISYNVFNFIFLLFLWLGFILTYSYCIRLFIHFFSRELFGVGGNRVSFNVTSLVIVTIGLYSIYLSYDVELCYFGLCFSIFILSCIIISLYFVGLFLSEDSVMESFFIEVGGWVRCLFGQDLLVNLIESFFASVSLLSCLMIFRWEYSILNYILGLTNFSFGDLLVGSTSMKLVIVGVFVILLFILF